MHWPDSHSVSSSTAPPGTRTTLHRDPDSRIERRRTFDCVLVTLELTDKEAAENVAAWTFATTYRVFVPRKTATGNADTTARQSVYLDNRPWIGDDGHALVDRWVATRVCVRAIRRALHAHPEATIAIASRVPKSVALGIGWLLANRDQSQLTEEDKKLAKCFVHESRRHPWSRLVLLYFDDGVRTYRITRVHRT